MTIRFPRLIGCGILGAILGLLSFGVLNALGDRAEERWDPSVTILFFAVAGGLFGSSLAVRGGNRKLAPYWLWIVLTFSATAMIPVPLVDGTGSVDIILVNWLYFSTYFREGSTIWTTILIGHSLVAVAIACGVTVVYELRHLRRGLPQYGRVFSLSEMFLMMGILACIFGALQWFKTPGAVKLELHQVRKLV